MMAVNAPSNGRKHIAEDRHDDSRGTAAPAHCTVRVPLE
jgi:hypothetical protein